MTFTHIFINSSKIYFLNRISETRSRYSFNVIKTESRNKEITKSPKTLKKFKDDINLFTFEEWDKSNKQIITLPGIKNIYFLGIDVIDKYKSYVPKIEVYKFPTDLKSILVDIKNNRNVYFAGHTGSGKTELVNQLAARLGRPFIRIQCSGDMKVSTFLGNKTIDIEKEQRIIKWIDSIFVTAAKIGAFVLVDEYDQAPAHVKTCLNGLFESDKRHFAIADKDGGEILTIENEGIHYNSRFFASGNTAGRMEETSDLYQGTGGSNLAQMNRWNLYLIYQLQGKELIAMLRLKIPSLGRKRAKDIANISYVINEYGKTINNPSILFSTRNSIELAHKIKHKVIDTYKAMYSVYFNKISELDYIEIKKKLVEQKLITIPNKVIKEKN